MLLALKYAQAHYGVDSVAAQRLNVIYPELPGLLPGVNGFRIFETRGALTAPEVLFIGVRPLREFGYSEIREFARKVLASLASNAPDTEHVALTLHGAGYGLDETESFEAEIAGLIDAVIGQRFSAKPRSGDGSREESW
jgi:hypothetical protein